MQNNPGRTVQCKISPDNFCYVCALFTTKSDRRPVKDDIRVNYFNYFGIHMNQDRSYVPTYICSSCRTGLTRWADDQGHMRFGKPAIWREPWNHAIDCYVCTTNINGFTMNNRHKVKYANVASLSRPVPHSDALPIPVPPIRIQRQNLAQQISPSTSSSAQVMNPSSASDQTDTPQLFSQADLNDFVRDLDLSKAKSELCASRLNDRNLLKPGNLSDAFSFLFVFIGDFP